jgi:hypothetical protein
MKLCNNYTQIGCQALKVIVKVIKVVMMMMSMILAIQHHRNVEKGRGYR